MTDITARERDIDKLLCHHSAELLHDDQISFSNRSEGVSATNSKNTDLRTECGQLRLDAETEIPSFFRALQTFSKKMSLGLCGFSTESSLLPFCKILAKCSRCCHLV